ncbi:MAG: hypothetical protein Q7R60_01120 [bacterium]|nr:hypothetical protein [bacterium]
MRNRNFSSLLILVAALSVVACNRIPTGPTPITDPPSLAPLEKTIDAPDVWHQLIDANNNSVAMKVRVNWVKRAKGGLCGTAGCFQMHAVACMDEVPNPTLSWFLANMTIQFYFSEDGIQPGPYAGSFGGGAFGIVPNGSCLDLNADGSAGSIMFPGTRYLIAWGTYGSLGSNFGEPGSSGRLGGSYVWDLGVY